MTNLTPHFTLEEFTHSQTAARKGIPNVPPTATPERANLQRLAEVMEGVRALLNDRPILISSGYRSIRVNKAVGGSKNSAHMSGLAVDFTCPSYGTPLEVCEALEQHMHDLGIDQLIYEYGTWVHLGLTSGTPRNAMLTIDKNGTRSGFA